MVWKVQLFALMDMCFLNTHTTSGCDIRLWNLQSPTAGNKTCNNENKEMDFQSVQFHQRLWRANSSIFGKSKLSKAWIKKACFALVLINWIRTVVVLIKTVNSILQKKSYFPFMLVDVSVAVGIKFHL